MPIGESMSTDQMKAELERLKAENAKLMNQASEGLAVKISEKTGAVMVIGLGRFPVTLYASQWLKLLATQDKIKAVCAKAPERKQSLAAVG
jgi:pyridoxal biosynthesis lyase PdxS